MGNTGPGIFPNPVLEQGTICYAINDSLNGINISGLKVSISLWNSRGEPAMHIFDGTQGPGNYQVKFSRRELPAGLYFIVLQIGNDIYTKKLIIQ